MDKSLPARPSLEQLKKLAKIEKFDVTAAATYLHKNAGILGVAYLEPNHKTAEIELYNKGNNMSNSFLNNSDAGGTGMQILEPNTFMDGNNPQYGRTASEDKTAFFNSNRELQVLQQLREEGNIVGQIEPGDTVTILTPQGQERKGRAVMFNADHHAWVLNMGGAHGTPGMADAENIVKVKKAPKKSSSNDCVRQNKAWKSAGITPRAKSVKQITACADCSYFKKNGSTKSCGLYGLPVVSSASELTSVVNKLTAGVPSDLKKAALVQIANRLPQQVTPKAASDKAPIVHQSSFTKERNYGFKEGQHFSGNLVHKAHVKGFTLKQITAAAEKKYGTLEASRGIREFVASLQKERGKIIMAKADADYLKKVGIHNEAIVGAAKCASCKAHTGKETHKAASVEGVTRATNPFVETTMGSVRGTRHTAATHFDSASVDKYHKAGHSIPKILKAASAKFGSAQASKAIRDWAHNLKNTNTKIALSQIDCTVLNKMGVKLGSQNAIVGAEKCGSCSFRNGMHCGMTGGTLIHFPGMNQTASNHKVAAGAPEDGRSILKEFDLMGSKPQGDIDMSAPSRADIQMNNVMDAGDL